MSKKLTAIAALATVAAMVATVAAAAPVAAKQRVSIDITTVGTFTLTALTPGAIKSDAGKASFCCWSRRYTTRNGQSIEIDNPQMTLTSKRGTIVARNQIGWIDVPDGWGVFTGTWKVIRGTGAYAGLVGGGRGAGVALANNDTRATYDGYLSPK
jgi:hypothetical protein